MVSQCKSSHLLSIVFYCSTYEHKQNHEYWSKCLHVYVGEERVEVIVDDRKRVRERENERENFCACVCVCTVCMCVIQSKA